MTAHLTNPGQGQRQARTESVDAIKLWATLGALALAFQV
jgi:hypothetical protein